MLQNAYFLAKIGADTAENEQHFAEILPTDALVCSVRSRTAAGQRAPASVEMMVAWSSAFVQTRKLFASFAKTWPFNQGLDWRKPKYKNVRQWNISRRYA